MITELKRVIEQVSREKGLDREVLVKTLEEAVKAAARKKVGSNYDLEVNFNEELGEIEVFEFKEVVEKVTNEHLEISLEAAHKIDPESEIGDSLGVKMDTDEFGRIAAQSAKQVIMQRLREAERNIVFGDYKDRRGEIVHGIVQRFDKGAIVVNLGRTEAELPVREQIPKETYKQGDRIRAFILDVRQFSRGPQIVLSRTHPNFLSALFENEVPEIAERIVSVVQVAREPGGRSKIAVTSKDSDVDPVGACVGMKGSRVQAVVQELRGEKIDIVTWDPDPAKFICNALAPAEIVRVIVDEDGRSMKVVVPDDQLSLAIGKKGQNVRLASKLSGWHLDVISETNYNRSLKEVYDMLLKLEGVGEKIALELYQAGFRSSEDLASAQVEELMEIPEMTEEKAKRIIEGAAEYVAMKAAQQAEERAKTAEEEARKAQEAAEAPAPSLGQDEAAGEPPVPEGQEDAAAGGPVAANEEALEGEKLAGADEGGEKEAEPEGERPGAGGHGEG
jgi:N utilization substance protein A